MDFTDLIPQQAGKPDLSFDDLMPAQPQQPAPDAPWYAKLGGAADDIVRLAANAATLGAADKFAAYMSGTGEQAERARTQGAAGRAG